MREGVNVRHLLAVAAMMLWAQSADAAFIDFEDLGDSTSVSTQYSGIAFTNAAVLSAGISLNEFEFPPRSGTNVIVDDGGPMTLVFDQLQAEFVAYVTYVAPVTLRAYDSTNSLLGTHTSSFLSNLALSGEAGSSPNELVMLSFATGIKTVTIEGESLGGSFTLDDLTLTPVPEPASVWLLGIALVGLATRRSVVARE